ncbi:MAG: hypothetical protein GY754_39435 [bacterium]|nr:hypothetical protein [bacterium]
MFCAIWPWLRVETGSGGSFDADIPAYVLLLIILNGFRDKFKKGILLTGAWKKSQCDNNLK